MSNSKPIKLIATFNESKAFDFLSRLNEEKREAQADYADRSSGVETTYTWHPHARGRLSEVLKYPEQKVFDDVSGDSVPQLSIDPRYKEVRSIISNALENINSEVAK